MSAFNVYSLAEYQVTVKVPVINSMAAYSISFGGRGEYIGNVTVSRNTNLYSTEADATGAYVHNKNLDTTGTVRIDVNQIASVVSEYINLCNALQNSNPGPNGLEITVTNTSGITVAKATGAVPAKIPDLTLGTTAQTRSCEFTCGEVNFN